MSEAKLDQLNEGLDVLIRLVAIGLCGERSQRDKIALLDSAGLRPKVIAELLGTTRNTVNVALTGIRKDSKRKKKLKPRAQADSAGELE